MSRPAAFPRDPWRRGAVELLAPCGSLDAAAAAAAAGADAVYLGMPDFSARRRAGNFDRPSLERAVAFLHRRRVRVYLAVNTLLAEDEIDRFADACLFAAEAGCDAFIVQDAGALRLLDELRTGVALHVSTQAALFTACEIARAAESGASRVVLPRELPLARIGELARTAPLPLEAFVHGALCSAVSGRCLLSSFSGARSGNRGLCAQCCRLEHSGGGRRGRLLSTGDLCLVDDLPALAAAGVDSFKIEGRLKKPAYVGAVTAAYRLALDDPRRAGEARALLERAYHRPFTRGYLGGPHPALVLPDESGNVGLEAGEIVAYDPERRTATALLRLELSAGDGIDLRGRGRSSGQAVPPMVRDGRRVTLARAGERVAFAVKEPCFPGDRIFLTRSDALEAAHRAAFPENEPPPGSTVRLRLSLSSGFARLAADTRCGEFAADLDVPVEPARGAGTPRAQIEATLDTADRGHGIETEGCEIDDGGRALFLPLSALKREVKLFKIKLSEWLERARAAERDGARERVRALRGRTLDRLAATPPCAGGPPLLLIELPPGGADDVPPGFDGLLPPSSADDPGLSPGRLPVLNSGALAEALGRGDPAPLFTPEARPDDLLALPPAALGAGVVPLFGRYELARIRHDLTPVLPPGAGPHPLASAEGEYLALRDGRSTRLYPAGFFSALSRAVDLREAGARRFCLLFPLLDPPARALLTRFAESAAALRAALASGDRAAWDALVRSLLAGYESRVLERRGRLE